MRHIWNKQDSQTSVDESATPQKLVLYNDYRPKLLSRVPMQKAIDNYNSVTTDDTTQGYDNFSFIPENGGHYESNVSTMSSTKPLAKVSSVPNILPPLTADFYKGEDLYEYSTIRSSGGKSGSLGDSPRASTNKLSVRPKLRDKCNTCVNYTETVLCAVSLACGLGNIFRLPQAVLLGGGLPFLVAYIILAILVGLPLLTLEIGLGQIVQEGFMKTWRAVPFFRGIGYVKLFAGCLLALYYSLCMGLAIYYILWHAQGEPPFRECLVLRMETDGYSATGVSGQDCVKKTFLEDPFTDPYWYAIFVAILFCLWVITTIWLLKRTKTYVIALQIYLITTIGCLIALIVKVAQFEEVPGIVKFGENAEWSKLGTADVWYHAAIQVFLSTHVGFGVFITNAGTIIKKVNPVWTAFGLMFVNLVVGTVVVLLVYAFTHEIVDKDPTPDSITQIHLLTMIYDVSKGVESRRDLSWALIAYFLITFSGFLSVTALLYTIFKAITLETRRRWWQVTVFSGIGGFILCALILLRKHFQIVHLLDHYIIGNLILITVIIEVFAFICFYGSQRLQSDFEFIIGNKLPRVYVAMWWLSPVILLGLFIWALSTLPLDGGIGLQPDPVWLYATGWSIVLISILFIIVTGLYHTTKVDEYYTYLDKLKAAFRFSRKWGPVDPIMRYNWVQWHSKAKDGERDFTLRRRGTRDYTHSVKNRSKYNARKYTPAESESSVNTDSIAFRKSDQNQNNITLMNLKNYNEPYVQQNGYTTTHLPQTHVPLRITSLVGTLDSPMGPPAGLGLARRGTYGGEDHKTTNNPLANLSTFKNELNDGQSEGYGTFRNGPYVIDSEDIDHVCHRKVSGYSEQATIL